MLQGPQFSLWAINSHYRFSSPLTGALFNCLVLGRVPLRILVLAGPKAYPYRKHPSRDVIFFGQNLSPKTLKIITSHDVLQPLKQALWASRDVIISGQICGSKLQRVFTSGDGCWLPITTQAFLHQLGGLIVQISRGNCPTPKIRMLSAVTSGRALRWRLLLPFISHPKIGDLKITSASTERQKRSQNLAPVLVIISGN